MAPTTSNVQQQHATGDENKDSRTPETTDSSTASDVDLLRTRVVLAELAARQERLAAELDASGIVSFSGRAEWLIGHRSADEQLAWDRHWRRLGVRSPEPRPERWGRDGSLSVVNAGRKRRRRTVFEGWQVELAIRALEKQEAAVRAEEGNAA